MQEATNNYSFKMCESISFGVKYIQDNTGFPNKSNKSSKSIIGSYIGRRTAHLDVFQCPRRSFHNRSEKHSGKK